MYKSLAGYCARRAGDMESRREETFDRLPTLARPYIALPSSSARGASKLKAPYCTFNVKISLQTRDVPSVVKNYCSFPNRPFPILRDRGLKIVHRFMDGLRSFLFPFTYYVFSILCIGMYFVQWFAHVQIQIYLCQQLLFIIQDPRLNLDVYSRDVWFCTYNLRELIMKCTRAMKCIVCNCFVKCD